jgi:hypothetical protein
LRRQARAAVEGCLRFWQGSLASSPFGSSRHLLSLGKTPHGRRGPRGAHSTVNAPSHSWRRPS